MVKYEEWYDEKGLLRDFYKVLQVSCNASEEVVNAAYKALMTHNHPDKGGSHRRATLINIARDALINHREEYDKKRFNHDGKIIGNYQLLEKIGEGGFGSTYKGKHTLLEELVCIKHSHRISAEDEEILLNEAKAIWDIRHYGLPAMRDILRLDDDSIALVMSYIPHPTLEKVIKKVGKLEPEHVAWITERSLTVLGYLHYRGVVHGDIKPGNIMINPKEHSVVLIDFGLSTIRPKKSSTSLGFTPYFAAPEQINDLSPPLPQTDFYSLGMTMIYALNGDDESALERKKISSDVPKQFRAFIERLIRYDIKSRPSWQEENLVETLGKIRIDAFGRRRSNVLQINGL